MNYANILCCRILGVIIVTIAAPFLLLYDLATWVGAGRSICWKRLRRLDAASEKSPPFVSNDADIIVSVCPLKIVDDPTSQKYVGRVKTNAWLMVDGSLKYARGRWWAPLADGGWVATSAPMDRQMFDVPHKRKSPVPFLRHRTPEETFDLCVYDVPDHHKKQSKRVPRRDGELHRRVREAIRMGTYKAHGTKTLYRDRCLWKALERHGYNVPLQGDGPFHLVKDANQVLREARMHVYPVHQTNSCLYMAPGKYLAYEGHHCLNVKMNDRYAKFTDEDGTTTVVPQELCQVLICFEST